MRKQHVTIYTDGSCIGGNAGGYAAYVRPDNGMAYTLVASEKDTTNNRMEIKAIIAALSSLNAPSVVTLISDSQYVLKSIRSWMKSWRKNGWVTITGAPVKNVDLFKELYDLASLHRIQTVWVRGHSGNKYNELCDTLARRAAESVDEYLTLRVSAYHE